MAWEFEIILDEKRKEKSMPIGVEAVFTAKSSPLCVISVPITSV